MARAIVLAEGHLGTGLAKTAHGLILHSVADEIVAVIDSGHRGRDAGDVVMGRALGIPVVADLEEAMGFGATRLYIGVATIGGIIPPAMRGTIGEALRSGLHVVNGLHQFLADDAEFVAIMKGGKGSVWDVRRPPEDLRVADGSVYRVAAPRVLIMGMDCDIGKRVTTVELWRSARGRGIDAGFVATGQTGCMLGPDAGAAIDRIPSDFAAGQVERMVCDVAAKGHEMILIAGQASIRHPAYSGVSLSILHGCAPHAVVLQVAPGRTQRAFFEGEGYKMGTVQEEIAMIEALGTGRVVALAVNGQHTGDAEAACKQLTKETGLPAIDPLHGDAGGLVDAVVDHLASVGFQSLASTALPAARVPARAPVHR